MVWIKGKWYASFPVTLFNQRKSMQNGGRPSFLCTITVGELHGLFEGSIIRSASMLSTSVFIMSCIFGFLGRYRYFKGVESFKVMWNFTSGVTPFIGVNFSTSPFRNSSNCC